MKNIIVFLTSISGIFSQSDYYTYGKSYGILIVYDCTYVGRRQVEVYYLPHLVVCGLSLKYLFVECLPSNFFFN